MDNVCSGYSVVYKGEKIGSAVIEKVGIRFRVAADTKNVDVKPPFRLAAVCNNRLVPVGVMMPCGSGYKYNRILSGGALRELGIDGVKEFTVIEDTDSVDIKNSEQLRTDYNSWRKDNEPGLYLEAGEFRRLFSACRDALVRCENDITYLAVPLIKGKEFPVMPVFCLGEAWRINGGIYIVFRIHNGKLSF